MTYQRFVEAVASNDRADIQTILLDINPDHASLQPENAIIVKPWTGKQDDAAGLINLIPFLECGSTRCRAGTWG